ncbi:uncharacterized protein TNCV_5111011 [Trichonephila clavipes]|nr:uncharacterized protein TNCV_5111011 [Trichonephila clavipes]
MPSRCSQSIFYSQRYRRSSSFHSNLGLSPFLHPRPAALSLPTLFLLFFRLLSLSLSRPPLFFSFLPVFPAFENIRGSPFLPPHVFSLVGPYESILEPQLIRAHWSIIRQSSTHPVSSQTSRCPTHAPTAEPLRPTVVVLPPLRTIRHCVCKATVSWLGSDLVHSRIVRQLFA